MPLQWTRKKFHIRNFFTHTGPRPAGDITRSMFGHALVVHLADISTTVQSINQSKTLFDFGFRAILFDYEKAFDLIDHRILVEKLCRLNLLTRIINWIIYLIGTNFRGHLVSRKKGRHISRVFILAIWVQNYFLKELIFAKMKNNHFISRILLLFYTSYC